MPDHNAAQTLRTALEFLGEAGERWHQGNFTDHGGIHSVVSVHDGCKVCALGALAVANHRLGRPGAMTSFFVGAYRRDAMALRLLQACLPEEYRRHRMTTDEVADDIAIFNDKETTSFADIKQAFTCAIERAEGTA